VCIGRVFTIPSPPPNIGIYFPTHVPMGISTENILLIGSAVPEGECRPKNQCAYSRWNCGKTPGIGRCWLGFEHFKRWENWCAWRIPRKATSLPNTSPVNGFMLLSIICSRMISVIWGKKKNFPTPYNVIHGTLFISVHWCKWKKKGSRLIRCSFFEAMHLQQLQERLEQDGRSSPAFRGNIMSLTASPGMP